LNNDSDVYQEKLHALISGQKSEVATKEEVAQYATDLKNILGSSSLTERKAFIRSFVEKTKLDSSYK